MSTALTIIAITAAVTNPLLAIQTQKFIERHSQKKSLKVDIFKQLMTTRSQNSRLSNEHIRALNMTDLAFHGKIKRGRAKRGDSEGKVLSSWKLYFAHLDTSYPNNDNVSDTIWNQTNSNLFLDLLSEVVKDIGYDFERVQLQTAIYSPMAHGTIENDKLEIRQGLAAVFSGENALKVEIINIPTRQGNQSIHYLSCGSIPNRSNSFLPKVLSQFPKLIPSVFAATSNYAFNSGVIRIWKVGIFPDLDRFGSRFAVDMYVPTRTVYHQSGTYLCI